MPKAGNGASGAGSSSSQPSLWGGGGGDAAPASRSYAGPSVPKSDPYTATGGSAKPDVPQLQSDGSYTSNASMPSMDTAPQPAKAALPSVSDVGSFSADLSSPLGLANSLKNDQKQAGGMFDGLSSALFGHGGLLAGPAEALGQGIGMTPIGPALGMAGQLASGAASLIPKPVSDTIAGSVNAAVGTAQGGLDTLSGAAEHFPIEAVPFVGQGLKQETDAQFAAIPDSPEKQAVQAQIAGDPLAGGHLKSDFVRKYTQAQQSVNPQLFPELATAPGSLGDTVVSLLGGASSFSRPFERGIAGAGKADGLNRLQAIEQVIESGGKLGFGTQIPGSNSVDSTPTEVEQYAYSQWKSGVWSSDQALTFLAASGAGFSHNPALELAGQVALDPTVWGSLGAAGLSKLGVAGLRLAAPEMVGAALRPAGTAAKYNVLGKLAEGEKASNIVRLLGTHVYTPVQDNLLGQAAKVVRTIIDPLHTIGGHGVVDNAAVDVTSEATTRVMQSAYGELASKQVAADMNELGLLPDLANAQATYGASKARELLITQYAQGLIDHNLAGALVGHTPSEVADTLMHNAPKDWAGLLKQTMVSVAKRDWTGDAVSNLGERMSAFFGGRSPGEWAKFLSGKSTDYLGHLHAATYGAATRQFLDAIGKGTNILGVAGAQAAKLPRLILLNKTTLTDIGARSILGDIKGAKSLEEAAAFISDAKRLYPELGYVTIDPANLEHSVQKFVTRVEHQIEDGVLPSQLVDREIAALPQPLQDLYGKMSNAFDFGFRPEDDKLFNLVRDGDAVGGWALGGTPWVDHVAESIPAYRGFGLLRYNAAGMPLIGEPLGKLTDYIDAGYKTLTARISSATISEAAKARFGALVAERVPGLAATDARKIFDAVSEAAGLHETTARGLSAKNMWEAVKPLVPDHLRLSGEMTSRDLMTMIVKAYEGDLRFVGLTQKFTGRAKSLLAAETGSNFAGQVSENLYQRIKFWANPVFQGQERIEPWVLNGMRGSNPAFGTKLTEIDRMGLQEARNLRDSGVVRATDVDQAEFSSYGKLGSDLAAELSRKDPSFWNQLVNTKGAKRVNEIRTNAANMGASFRNIFDSAQPGLWDRIVAHYSGSEKALVSDAEAAARYIAEQHLAGDVTIQSVIRPGDDLNAFHNAISMTEMFQPNSLGEMKGLNLDFMARAMGWTTLDGKSIDSVGALRAALADPRSGITMDRVGDTLRSFGAHEDYIRRVTNALDFHYDGFWRTAAQRFNLTPAESQRLQGMFSEAARVRGMTPVDYMSQVYSPMIQGGSKASIESLASGVSILRASKGADISDLATQLADIFRHHLDPSGQDALMEAWKNDLPGQINTSMQKGQKVASQNLQATLSEFRGGQANAGGAVLPTHVISPEGFQRGRFASQTEIDQLTEQGKTILADKANAAREPIFQGPATGMRPDGTLVLNSKGPIAKDVVDVPPERAPTGVRLKGLTGKPDSLDYTSFSSSHEVIWYGPDGKAHGYVSLSRPDATADRGYLSTYVDPEYRRQGVATRLYNELEKHQDISDVTGTTVTAEGRAFTEARAARAAAPKVAYDHMVDGMFDRVQHEWGGATYDPHTGQFLEHEPFVYHGTTAGNQQSIALGGVNRGSFTNDLARTDQYARESGGKPGLVYRTKPSTLRGGVKRFGDNSQIDNPRATADTLEFSNDGGKSWHPVDRTNAPGGPYFSAVGNQADMPIADAADPAKFRAAVDKFVADNRSELEKADHYVGVFRNQDTGLVEFDVSIAVKSEREAEAVQLAAPQYQTGGAYNLYGGPDAPGVFAPVNRGNWLAAHSEAFGKAIQARLAEVEKLTPAAVKATAKNPDVERAVQQFAKWSRRSLAHGLLADDPQYAELFTRLTKVPTEAATPANLMHTMLVNRVVQAQRMAAEDAFRLTYFARNRTFLERSLNHPFFGIYPASYMWGKIAPEMARFMATEPFGLRTGAALKAANDFQVSLATQREMDPAFGDAIDKLGKSPTVWFLGYAMPSVPWDVGSAAPSLWRDIAAQGADNQARVDRGEAPKPIDLTHALTKVGDYINPLRPATQIERPLGELGNILNGGAPADKKAAAGAETKSAAQQAKYEKAVALAIVGVETAQSRLKTAKTPAAKKSAQTRLDAAQFTLTNAQHILRDAYPDSEKLNVQPGGATAAPGATPEPSAGADLKSTLTDQLGELQSTLFGH